MRECQTSDDRLFAFVDGVETDLESHVSTCDHCQEFLAELWVGELQTDLSESVLRQIRFDEFLRELGQLTLDVAGAMGRALVEFGPGRAEPPEFLEEEEPGSAGDTNLPAAEADEE